MRKYLSIILVLWLSGIGSAQSMSGPEDNNRDSLTSELDAEVELCPTIPFDETVDLYMPKFLLTADFYKDRYQEKDLMFKVVDNFGNGFGELYGTRNVRPVLHGVAYRGGANNYYHKTSKRKNQNPLPPDGIDNLCQEGFSKSVYLYRTNFEDAPNYHDCDCINGTDNRMDYFQLDYFDDKHVYEIMEMVYKSATSDHQGPLYIHCWNGWHASGFLAAVILKQFCGFNDIQAVAYWDLGTDGANKSPRYNKTRQRIRDFEPFPEFIIKDSLGNRICPDMPEITDPSQLHIDIEQLVIVPEAVPVGMNIILERVSFSPGHTTLANPNGNQDLLNLEKALKQHTDLKVEVGGYTDNSGSWSTNVDLSQKRARFVYDWLFGRGIDASRITYKGYGPNNPRYSNRYRDGRAGNRRIEIKLLDKKEGASDLLVDESYHSADGDTASAEIESVILPSYDVEKEYKEGETVVLKKVMFEPYSTVLVSPDDNPDILAVIDALNRNSELKVEIGGYTDSWGDTTLNDSLSTERAKAVYHQIIAGGISPDRVSYHGYGPLKPVADNRIRAGRDKNRRIEVKIIEQ